MIEDAMLLTGVCVAATLFAWTMWFAFKVTSCERKGHEWQALDHQALGRVAHVCRRCGAIS